MRRPEVGILALAILAACSIPTELPNWDMTWNIPVPDGNAMNIPVTSFLPPGVTTVGTPPTAFSATVSSAPPINRTLGAQCPACPNATAPKPAFTAPPATSNINLAAGTSLTSATLTTGSQVVVALNNGFTFDPIKPPGGTAGSVSLTVNNGATTLGTTTLSGATSAIPAGQTTNVTIQLAGPINTSSPITVTMTMDSPAGAAGSPVAMNSTQPFTATTTPTLNISTATVTIGAQVVSSTPRPIDMSGIDSSVIKRITNDNQTRGTMFFTLTNPFTVGGATTVTFASAAGTPAITPITKNVTLTAATNGTTPSVTTVALPFTGVQLRTILGHNLVATFGGNTAAGSLTVTPTQQVKVSSRLQLNINIKEQ